MILLSLTWRRVTFLSFFFIAVITLYFFGVPARWLTPSERFLVPRDLLKALKGPRQCHSTACSEELA